MEDFLRSYGYLAVFLGSTIEGELILMTAGYFAYTGVLDLKMVMLYAFLGTLIADQGCFYLGRFYGPRILKRFPTLEAKSQRVFSLLHKYKGLFIMSFRFIYGIRVASPILIGAGQINPRFFSLLNVPAAFIWAVTIAYVGYIFGETFDLILKNIHTVQKYGLLVGVPLVVSIWVAIKMYRKKYK